MIGSKAAEVPSGASVALFSCTNTAVPVERKEVIHIKNMVCDRCIRTVRECFEAEGLPVRHIELGRVVLGAAPSGPALEKVNERLGTHGFEILQDPDEITVERIKNVLIKEFSQLPVEHRIRLSELLPERLHHDYAHLSKLFSRLTGTTIERYLILLRIEKAKELISYGQHTFSEIAWMLGYSSPQHLSNQFRQVTGMSMSDYARLPEKPRKSLDKLL